MIRRRCASCHKNTPDHNVNGIPFNWGIRREKEKPLLGRETGSHERIVIPNDPAGRYDSNVLVNLLRPEQSNLLVAPLAREAGGCGLCGKAVFKDKQDPDYQKLLAAINGGKQVLDARPAWGMPGWKPNPQYVREMKRFGLLPDTFDPAAQTLDPFAMDQAYWR